MATMRRAKSNVGNKTTKKVDLSKVEPKKRSGKSTRRKKKS